MTDDSAGHPAEGAPARRVGKDERLFTLVQCLLASEQHLTARRIRETVAGYGGDDDEPDDAVKRKFERDKNVLRDMGIPIETVRDPSTGEEGYRIDRAAYELAPIELTTDESVVVMVAAQVWRQGKLAGPAAGALMKLRASGAPVVEDAGLDTLIETAEPAFDAVWRACRDARPITFGYQKRDGARAQRRELEPWGMVCRNGLWYVAGHDRDRDAVRVFRLSRVVGVVTPSGEPGTVVVPADVDVRALVGDWGGGGPTPRTATLLIREGRANGLRRYAHTVAPEPGRPGWDHVELNLFGTESLAGTVASFGADVIVADPPDLREAVIRRLKGALA